MRILSIIIGIALAALLLGPTAFSSTDLEVRGEYGRTALLRAVDRIGAIGLGHDKVQALIAAGADVNSQDDLGYTALMLGRFDMVVVKMLLQAGADVNLVNKLGMTVLMIASAEDRLDLGRLLLTAQRDHTIKVITLKQINNTIQFNWQVDISPTSFEIEYFLLYDYYSSRNTHTVDGRSRSFYLTNILPNRTYVFRIKAKGPNGMTSYSDLKVIRTSGN